MDKKSSSPPRGCGPTSLTWPSPPPQPEETRVQVPVPTAAMLQAAREAQRAPEARAVLILKQVAADQPETLKYG